MANEFTVLAEDHTQSFSDRVIKGSKVKYSFDFKPWAEDTANVSTVEWTVKSGDASISDEQLSNNIATSFLTFSDTGKTRVEIKATSEPGDILVAFLTILSTDPSEIEAFEDYV